MANAAAWAREMKLSRDDIREFGFLPMEELPDPLPMADCIRTYLASMEFSGIADIFRRNGLDYKYGLLLAGPPDTGKHTAATAILATLLKKSTYSTWSWVTAQDLADASEEEAMERLAAFFQPYIDREITISSQLPMNREVLLLEKLEESEYFPMLLRTLQTLLEGCREGDLAAPLVIFVTEAEPQVCRPLYRDLMHLAFRLPNAAERSHYLNRWFACVAESSHLGLEEQTKIRVNGLTLEALTRQTAGCSYAQLENLVSFAKLRCIYKATSAGIREAARFTMADHPLNVQELAQLLPAIGAEEAQPVQAAVPTEQVLAPLMTQLTQAIAAIPAAVGQPRSQTQTPVVDSRYTKQDVDNLQKLISDNTFDPRKKELLKHSW